MKPVSALSVEKIMRMMPEAKSQRHSHIGPKFPQTVQCPYTADTDTLRTYTHTIVHIQGVTGGTDQTSGECSLGLTIPI